MYTPLMSPHNNLFVSVLEPVADTANDVTSDDRVAVNKKIIDTFNRLQVVLAERQYTMIRECKQIAYDSIANIRSRAGKRSVAFEEISSDPKESRTVTQYSSLHEVISQFGAVVVFSPSLSAIQSGVAVPLATVNKKRKFGLSLKDCYGSPVNGEVPIAASVVRCSDGKKVEVVVFKEDQCTLTCTPDTVGEYELSVKVRGTHIKNSPYQMWARYERDLSKLSQQCVYYNLDHTCSSYGVAVHSNGDVFVTCYAEGYVQVCSKGGSEKRKIGTKGSGDGQFIGPRGIALVGDILYVADMDNHRVQKWTIHGAYLGKFGSEGSDNGQLYSPIGVAYDGKDHILVTDRNRVQIFTLDGTFIRAIYCEFVHIDAAIDNDGNIHAPLHIKGRVQVFSSDGTKLYDYGNNMCYPYSITIDDNGYRYITTGRGFYILDHTGNQVNKIDINSTAVALDTEGYIYVARPRTLVCF